MGGINPEKPNHALNVLTQEHCKTIFQATSQFFAAHAELEAAVISEANDELNTAAIERAHQAMSQVSTAIREGAERLASTTLPLAQAEGTWHRDYYSRQRDDFAALAELSTGLVSLLGREQVINAANRRTLQQSLWHQEENSQIRALSIEFVNRLIGLLQHHVQVVVDTNE